MPGRSSAINLPINSVVKIVAVNYTDPENINTWAEIQTGSGVVIDAEKKYIITNAHVVIEGDRTSSIFSTHLICTIQSAADSADCGYTAELLYADLETDIALLRVNGNPPGKPQATFNKPAINLDTMRTPEIGEQITIIGFPFLGGDTITISQGVAGGFLTGDNDEILAIKTDSNLISGVSGGLALDENGNMIGIPSRYFTDYYSSERIGVILDGMLVKNWINNATQLQFDGTPMLYTATPTTVTGLKSKYSPIGSADSRWKLTWEPAIAEADIRKYEIAYSTDEYFLYDTRFDTIFTPDSDTTFIFTADKKTTYYAAIRAIDKNNAKSDNWSDVIELNPYSEGMVFADIGLAHENFYAIDFLKNSYIISGYPDGTFRPSGTIKRGELMKIVVLGHDVYPESQDYNNCFSDVQDQWFAVYVCYAKEQGWISGYSDGSFKPGQDVNIVESLKIIEEVYEMPFSRVATTHLPEAIKNQWYAPYIALADEFNILTDDIVTLDPSLKISRAKTAEHLYRTILLAPHKNKYSSVPWKDANNNKTLDLKVLMGLTDYTEWVYRLHTDVAINATDYTLQMDQQCIFFKDQDCYSKRLLAGDTFLSTAEYVITSKNMFHYMTVTGSANPTTGYVILFGQPALELAVNNAVQYSRSKNPIEIDDGAGGRIRIFDMVSYFSFLGNEKLDTPFGQKNTLKIQKTSFGRSEIISQIFQEEGTIHMESIYYFIPGVGIAKEIATITFQLNGREEVSLYDNTMDLVEYK
ncbi:MAG: trypsin-like peptidase domain-containing protein [Patescibacteria group bacterium]